MKAVLVGCGGISQVWLEGIAAVNALEVVGLVDILEANARERAAEFGLDVRTGTSLEAMLAATQPDIVFDCTVPAAHYDVVTTALAAGCHVFGEKPLADTLQQALEMVAAAKTSGKTYAVMQNRRYDPNIRALRDFLQSGVIGTITTLHADFFIGAHFGGFREEMPHVLVKDMAIHTFDAARFLTHTDPRSAYCLEWNPKGSWYSQDASATAVFEMTGGLVFTYRGSWCSEGLHTSWESAWRIIGTKGTVIWDAAGVRCEVVDKAEGFIYSHVPVTMPEPEPNTTVNWHGAAIEAFVTAVQAGQTPETSCEDNLRSLQMVFAAAQSSETRRVVDIPQKTPPEKSSLERKLT